MSRFQIIQQPKPVQRVMMHLACWLVLFGIRLYLTCISFTVYSGLPLSIVSLLSLSNTVLTAGMFYLFTGAGWYLIRRRRWPGLVMLLIAGFCAYTFLDTVSEKTILFTCRPCLITLRSGQPQYFNLLSSGIVLILLKRLLTLGVPFNLLLTLSIPISLKLGLNAWRTHTKTLQLAKENLELELNFLKAQLNPHFLFNSMNNIYGTILKGEHERSAGMVARLSALLRYMLYETGSSYVPLSKEIKLMNDYMELEKIRLNFTRVQVDYQLRDTDHLIPPLLFMPLLENAFKFCSDEPDSYIQLSLAAASDELRFKLTNSRHTGQNEAGGIGLNNFNKRLDLYYARKYTYQVIDDEQLYQVFLTISLS